MNENLKAIEDYKILAKKEKEKIEEEIDQLKKKRIKKEQEIQNSEDKQSRTLKKIIIR